MNNSASNSSSHHYLISTSLLSEEQKESSNGIIGGCNNILRRINPKNRKKCINALSELLSSTSSCASSSAAGTDNKDLFLSQPHVHGCAFFDDFEIMQQQTTIPKWFICCDMNRHPYNRMSYRSPWTNMYYERSSDSDGIISETEMATAGRLRNLEIQANELWETYARLYYGTTTTDSIVITSVFLWDDNSQNINKQQHSINNIVFAGYFVINKKVTLVEGVVAADASNNNNNNKEITWISLHQVQVINKPNEKCLVYIVNSTVDITITSAATDNSHHYHALKGQYHRHMEKEQHQQTQQTQQQQQHLTNLGQMIEQIEIDIRSNMNSLSIQKTKDVIASILAVNTINSTGKGSNKDTQQQHATMLSQAILLRKKQQQ